MVKVLGISGSPVKDSNTDTLIKTIMDATGAEQELIKLSKIKVGPCRACKQCAYTNECILDDDFKWLSKKVLDADVIVMGTPVMGSAASAFIKAFTERLWSLRHVKLLTQSKIAAGVVIGWAGTEQVSEWLIHSMRIGSGMDVVGSITANGTPACFTCGPGETCRFSLMNTAKIVEKMTGEKFGLEKIYEGYLEELPDNDPLANPSYKVIKCISVKDQPEAMQKAEEIGKLIAEKLQQD